LRFKNHQLNPASAPARPRPESNQIRIGVPVVGDDVCMLSGVGALGAWVLAPNTLGLWLGLGDEVGRDTEDDFARSFLGATVTEVRLVIALLRYRRGGAAGVREIVGVGEGLGVGIGGEFDESPSPVAAVTATVWDVLLLAPLLSVRVSLIV
jgi:hypothetical protein